MCDFRTSSVYPSVLPSPVLQPYINYVVNFIHLGYQLIVSGECRGVPISCGRLDESSGQKVQGSDTNKSRNHRTL